MILSDAVMLGCVVLLCALNVFFKCLLRLSVVSRVGNSTHGDEEKNVRSQKQSESICEDVEPVLSLEECSHKRISGRNESAASLCQMLKIQHKEYKYAVSQKNDE